MLRHHIKLFHSIDFLGNQTEGKKKKKRERKEEEGLREGERKTVVALGLFGKLGYVDVVLSFFIGRHG